MVFSSRQMVFYVVTRKILRQKQKCKLDKGQSTLSKSEFPLHAQNLALCKFYFQSTWDGTSGIIPLGGLLFCKNLGPKWQKLNNPPGGLIKKVR